jgi:gluconolactonase
MSITKLADGLGWPEGPSPLADGRIIFVETYRSQVSVWEEGRGVSRFAYVGGGPNAVLAASDGCCYVTQNGGVIGPWRAVDQRPPSIQRITPEGVVEIMVTEIDGHTLRAPNDLAFGPDGTLYFTDPGGPFDPVNRPDRSRLFALNPDGTGRVLEELEAVYSNGIVVEANGSIVWVESYTGAVKRRSPTGTITQLCILPERGKPDGLKVAANGDLYITALIAEGVDVVAPDGRYRHLLSVGKVPTNCVFVGNTLYVTDGGHLGLSADPDMAGALWRVELDGIEGLPLFPGGIARSVIAS